MATDIIQRIANAFEADQQRRGEPVLPGELPVCYEAITDEWLTAILCRDHRGAKVVAHALDVPDNGSSNRRRIFLEYNDAGVDAGLPTRLFCKASHDLQNRIVLGISGGAHCEATFYNKIRQYLQIEGPACYFAQVDTESFNSLVMLEDLSGSAQAFCSHHTAITRQRAESQIRLLANVHGNCYGNPTLKAAIKELPSWHEYFVGTLAFGMDKGSNAGFLAAEEVIPARLYVRFEEIWPATVRSAEMHNALPATLAHGDVHLKNWYVAGNGEMGITDWQCCNRGHWSRDFAYTISTALTVENRRLWERDLLSMYLALLADNGGPRVSFDEAWNQYRAQLLSALAWWTVTLTPPEGLPDMQPRDITLEFIRRISTAIDDLDALAAVV